MSQGTYVSWFRFVCFLSLALWLVAPLASAQDDSPRSQLGERQRLVERKMTELESRFTIIAEQLREKDPERADRIIAAYQQAKETLIIKRMQEVAQLLDERKYDQAGLLLDSIVQSLDELVRLLLNQRDERLTKQQEIDMLQRWKDAIQSIQQEQKRQTRETDKVANKDQTLADLDRQIQELAAIIDRQRGLLNRTREQSGGGLPAMDSLADEQFDIREDTKKLLNEIGDGEPQSDTGLDANREGQAGEGQPPTGQQQGNPTGESNPNENKSDPNNPGSDPAKDSKSEGQPSSSEGSPTGKQPTSPSGGKQPPRPGQQPLGHATQSQERSEQKLVAGKPTDAERQQEQAINELEDAKAELERERRRIASLPPEAFEKMAAEQRRTRDVTLELEKEMAEAPKSSRPQEGDGDGQPGQPGQKQLGEAGDAMDGAAENLDQQDATQGERKQREAERRLQEALEEIEERLNQLRDETREEKLNRLEARFTEMLNRQRIASLLATELNDKRAYLGPLSRRDQLVVMRLATEEAEIAELGQQAYDLLLEDGTSIVFPEVVEDLRQDLLRVSQFLQEERTDHLTQLLQREIEATLEELLEALKEAKKQGGGGGGGGGGGQQPLIKKSSELKMLRANQMRVNRQTRQLDAMRQVDGLDDSLEVEIRRTGQRQADYMRILERIIEESDE
ncbi:MAG TPA: hypothetical protein PKD54_09720 [Pirellulaceae bacterium]|nr:hypothetical protein [Pirellulaceae bacterium]